MSTKPFDPDQLFDDIDAFDDVDDIDHSSIAAQFGQALIADAATPDEAEFESLELEDIDFDVIEDFSESQTQTGAGAAISASESPRSAPAKPFILTEGALIGERFIMNSILDRGSLGEVWHVFDTKLQRDFALKVIKLSRVLSPKERNEQREEIDQRVLREIGAAQHSSTICHHIIQIFDIGKLPNDDPFIVMEYLDGQNLHDWMSVHLPVDWTVVRDIAIQITAALKALHQKSFIHRDIKPSNIFTIEGESPSIPWIKLIDFGCVKDIEGASITRTPSSIGTDRYMAPELATFNEASEPLTNRCDIFSLGVVLFEMLTGHNPLPSSSTQRNAIYRKGLDFCAQFAPTDCPTWLTELVDQCLSLQAYQRPSAADLHAALKDGAANAAGDQMLFEAAIDEPRVAPAPMPRPVQPVAQATPDNAPSTPPPSSVAAVRPAPAPMSLDSDSASKPFIDKRPVRYGAAPSQRSLAPIAIAVFAGMLIIAAALFFTQKPAPAPAQAPVLAASSEPTLAFKPRGPVDQDDFPARPAHAGPQTSAAPRSVAKQPDTAPSAPPSVAPQSSPKPIKRAPRPIAKTRVRPRRTPRKGLSKSFADVASVARAGGPTAAGAPPPVPAAGAPTVITRFNDAAGPQFIDETTPADATGSVSLPYNTRLPARLSAGISSAAHGTVLAVLSSDVMVGGKPVLRKGDVVRGRSSNTSDRIKVSFSEVQRGGTMIKFVGVAYSSADNFPGLKAKKKMLPTQERNSNAAARGALTTVNTVAAQLGGGIGGELSRNVVRETTGDARADFQERQPFVLTVPKATRFTILVTGK